MVPKQPGGLIKRGRDQQPARDKEYLEHTYLRSNDTLSISTYFLDAELSTRDNRCNTNLTHVAAESYQ